MRKENLKNRLIIIFSYLIMLFVTSNISFAVTNQIPFEYNIIPDTKKGTPIDTNYQKELTFSLYEHIDKVYYNNELVEIEDDEFSIDVSDLNGEVELVFTNEENKVAKVKYYFSDENGLLKGYKLISNSNANVYVTTIRGIKVLYMSNDKKVINNIRDYIEKLPENVIENVKTIKLIPYENKSNVAGVTVDDTITLYKFSKYSVQTQKHILYHEIAHTWANKLMNKKIIDYSYTKYAEVVKKDKKSVSNYSKSYAQSNGRYSEDFADSVAFYLINPSFKKNYPNRTAYIKMLLEK